MTGRRRHGLARMWLLVLLGIAPLALAGVLVTSLAGHTARGRLTNPGEMTALLPGLTVEEMGHPSRGLIVTSLRSGGEAMAAGIVVGDRIIAIDGHPSRTLHQALGYLDRDRRRMIVVKLVHDHDIRHVTLRRDGNGSHGA